MSGVTVRCHRIPRVDMYARSLALCERGRMRVGAGARL